MNDFDDIGACYAEQDYFEENYPELAESQQEKELFLFDEDLIRDYDEYY